MIVTAWNNGKHHESGAGYGLKISQKERDQYFKREWSSVFLMLPSSNTVIEININKGSFWDNCRELIHKEIGLWLRTNGFAPWPDRKPPKFELIAKEKARFQLKILE